MWLGGRGWLGFTLGRKRRGFGCSSVRIPSGVLLRRPRLVSWEEIGKGSRQDLGDGFGRAAAVATNTFEGGLVWGLLGDEFPAASFGGADWGF
jgi:hypothetical protein